MVKVRVCTVHCSVLMNPLLCISATMPILCLLFNTVFDKLLKKGTVTRYDSFVLNVSFGLRDGQSLGEKANITER